MRKLKAWKVNANHIEEFLETLQFGEDEGCYGINVYCQAGNPFVVMAACLSNVQIEAKLTRLSIRTPKIDEDTR